MKKIFTFFTGLVLLSLCSTAQVVTVTNPGNTTPVLAANYGSLALAITALNTITAISGPVTITLNAGNAQTAPAGGYAIQFSAVTTAANNITIEGSNNTITAFTQQTTGNLNDAIFKIIGADYITIQHFTMQENALNINSTAAFNDMTEWGVALLHASVTNGAQHNTIQNNTISLNRTYRNAFGIYSNARHSATSVTSPNDATSPAGANSGNKVYSNAISNVDHGIVFIGSGTAANMDDGNDIGGSSAATGNTITNWGDGPTALSGFLSVTGFGYCISVNQQVNENISYNTITSAAVSGIASTVGGILKVYTLSSPTGTVTSNITHNAITITNTNASGFLTGISSANSNLSTHTINITYNTITNCVINAAGATTSLIGITNTAPCGTMNITNNTISNCLINGAAAGSAFTGITNAAACGTVNITNNTISGLSTSSTTAGYTAINNSAGVITALNITNNQVGTASSPAVTFSAATTGSVDCIHNQSTASSCIVNISNNAIDGVNCVSLGGTQHYGISNIGNGSSISIDNNQLGTASGTFISFSAANSTTVQGIMTQGGNAATALSIQQNNFTGFVHSVTGSSYHYYINSGTAVLSQNISGNTFTGLVANTTGVVTFIYKNNNQASGSSFIADNNQVVSGFTKTASGSVIFISATTSSVSGSTISITNNIFSNVSSVTDIYGIYVSDGATITSGPSATVTGNVLTNISSLSGQILVIQVSRAYSTNCSGNSISNITGASYIYGLLFNLNNGQGIHTCAGNSIDSMTTSGPSVSVYGVYGGTPAMAAFNVNNNTITRLSSSSTSNNIYGLYTPGSATMPLNVYDNVIHGNYALLNTSAVTGMYLSGFGSGSVYRNRIYDLRHDGPSTTSPSVSGLTIAGGADLDVYNNFISDLKAPLTNNATAIRALYVSSSQANSAYRLYYNSVYLNANSTGTNFGTAGLHHAASATATTAALTLINNIIVNTSTPNGTGRTIAYQRTNTSLSNYDAASDYNLFYAGTPASNKLIFYDGTNSNQTLAAYQTLVSTIDAHSISAMPNFTSATDLHLTSVNCQIDGRGIPVTVTTDIDGATRDVSIPDIGADEFTASPNTTLAGVAGTALCETRNVTAAGTVYSTNTCDRIVKVRSSGADPVSGQVNACVTLDATQQIFNAQPYVQRHFDIEPATGNTTTTSATITLYFTDAEFVTFNTTNPAWPQLPTFAGGGSADPNRVNLAITQYHGTPTTTPSSPANYTVSGPGVFIDPVDANIVWNGSYWAVTFDVTGFSGFYAHSHIANVPLTVKLNYFKGSKTNDAHLLDWKVTCSATPHVTMILERSDKSNGIFTAINTINADATRCDQPFSYTDAQPLKGMNYYRLKIIDADGKSGYSNVVALLNAVKGFEFVQVTPNPVAAGQGFRLNVVSAGAGDMKLLVTDMTGRVVMKQMAKLGSGTNIIDISTANLSAGIYNVNGMMENGNRKTVKVVVN